MKIRFETYRKFFDISIRKEKAEKKNPLRKQQKL